MRKKTKLELAWIGKENRPKLEPRILIQKREKPYGATTNNEKLVHTMLGPVFDVDAMQESRGDESRLTQSGKVRINVH